MMAITARYLPPTSTQPARIVATTEGRHRVTVPYALNGSSSPIAPYWHAAYTLCERQGWYGRLVCGAITNGYVFVFDARGCSGTTLTPPDPAEWIPSDSSGLQPEREPSPRERRRCEACDGYLRPPERRHGPNLAGECSCWMTGHVQRP